MNRDYGDYPGVTDVLQVLAKPQLIEWASRLGLKGIYWRDYTDPLKQVGSLVHRMILADLSGIDPSAFYYRYNQHVIDMAENSFISYLAWRKGRTIDPIFTETPLLSEVHGYGGPPDFLGFIDGTLTLLDYKTGSGVYPDHWIQVAAYSMLMVENGLDAPENHVVLHIPRAEDEIFCAPEKKTLKVEWEIFKHLLAIYKLQKNGRIK